MSNGEPDGGPMVSPDANDLGSGVQPGQVIIRVAPDATAGTAPSFLANLPVWGVQSEVAGSGAPTQTGDGALDQALESIGAQALYRVWSGELGSEGAAVASADATSDAFPELASLVLVEFDPQRNVDEAVQTLQNVPTVAEASPSGVFTTALVPNDPDYASQWGLAHINCPDAWDTTTGSNTVIVAVVDTGCDLTHSDLSGQLEPGWNWVAPGTNPQDDNGHGTHVGGTIAAIGNNGADCASVAWGCRVLPVKALNAQGRALGINVAMGIVWAVVRGAWIINLSLQGLTNDLTLRAAMSGAQRRGVLVCAAMGNWGWGETQPSYPARYAADFDNVVAVGAVDSNHRRSIWGGGQSSNTGSWIGVTAPGTDILSTKNGGGTVLMSGTSMACPHVAGLAALIWSVNQSIGAKGVIDLIKSSATALRDDPADPVPNASYGYGLIDAKAALVAASSPTPTGTPTPVGP